jgi:hypothetical protein
MLAKSRKILIVALAVVALTSGTFFTHALLAGSLTRWLGHDRLVKGHASCWQHTPLGVINVCGNDN